MWEQNLHVCFVYVESCLAMCVVIMLKEIMLMQKPNYEYLRLLFIIEQQLISLLPGIVVSYVLKIVAVIFFRVNMVLKTSVIHTLITEHQVFY